MVQENDGRFRVYWNTINPDGSTRNNKCRVKDRKEGLEKCRILEEELSQTGLVEETIIDPEDRIMIDRFYKTNPSISLAAKQEGRGSLQGMEKAQAPDGIQQGKHPPHPLKSQCLQGSIRKENRQHHPEG